MGRTTTTFMCLLAITAWPVYGGMLYDASLGKLPQELGWTYSGDGGNPSPFVSGGLLHEHTTAGEQYWRVSDPTVEAASQFRLEAELRVISSNYIPNVGTGTREGYYFILFGQNLGQFYVGISDGGININTISVPNVPPIPYPIAGDAFHKYVLEIAGGLGKLTIDGTPISEQPVLGWYDTGYSVAFGGVAGRSRSETELKYICYSTDGSSCAPSTALPEVANGYAAILALGVFGGLRRLIRRGC